MARREKDLTGWSFKLHEAPANLPRKRASRRVNLTPTPSGDRITMTRDSDDMTIGVGDVVQLDLGDHCLIIDIALGINNFLELTVARLTSGEDGELVLTPTIEVLNDVQHVHSKKSVGTSGKLNDFRVTHAIDPEVNNRHKFTWTERIERLLLAGKQDFIEWIRSVTAAKPTKRKELVTSTPTKKPTYVFSSASEDDDSGDEFKSAEEDNHDTEDEDVKLSEDEEEAKPLAPATPRKRGRPASASPRKNARKEKPAAEDDAFHFMEAVLLPSKLKKKLFKTMRTPQKANKGKLDLLMLSPSKKQQKLDVPASNMELDKDSEAFKQLKAKLEAGAVFDMVVGREDEFMTIMMNIQDGVSSGEGCCIYISGTPGTGKTATIRHVISALQQEAAEGLLPEFDFYEACGLRMILATYVYEMLWEQLTGYKVSPTNALTLLDEYFRRGKAPRPLVVFLDELDSMVSSKQEVLYNLLNWPTYPGSKLIVVAAANTMDLPERMLANKVLSRLGLRRMQFPGYTFSQLEDIFNHRLQSLATEALSEGAAQVVIQPQALEFAARKVASVAGDARKALGIARRAVELCLADLRASNNSIENHPLTMNHIMRAISQFNQASSPQPFLKSLPFASKLLLAAMVLCTKRLSLAELLLRDVIVEMYNMVQLMTLKHATAPFRAIESSSNYLELLYGNLKFYYDGEGAPKEVENIRVLQFAYIVKELCECGIVAALDHGAELYKKIRFNLHRDEVEKALASDDEVSALIKRAHTKRVLSLNRISVSSEGSSDRTMSNSGTSCMDADNASSTPPNAPVSLLALLNGYRPKPIEIQPPQPPQPPSPPPQEPQVMVPNSSFEDTDADELTEPDSFLENHADTAQQLKSDHELKELERRMLGGARMVSGSDLFQMLGPKPRKPPPVPQEPLPSTKPANSNPIILELLSPHGSDDEVVEIPLTSELEAKMPKGKSVSAKDLLGGFGKRTKSKKASKRPKVMVTLQVPPDALQSIQKSYNPLKVKGSFNLSDSPAPSIFASMMKSLADNTIKRTPLQKLKELEAPWVSRELFHVTEEPRARGSSPLNLPFPLRSAEKEDSDTSSYNYPILVPQPTPRISIERGTETQDVPTLVSQRLLARSAPLAGIYNRFLHPDVPKETTLSLWVDKFTPTRMEELLLDRNLARRIRHWITNSFARLKNSTLSKPRNELLAARRQREQRRLATLHGFIVDDYDMDEGEEDTDEEVFMPILILYGPPGLGKLTAVYTAMNELGGYVHEINLGIPRSRRDINSVLKEYCTTHTVHQQDNSQGFRKGLVLLEDVDVLFEQDRTFWQLVQEMLNISRRPIVMTCSLLESIPGLLLEHAMEEEAVVCMGSSTVPREVFNDYLWLCGLALGFDIEPSVLDTILDESMLYPGVGRSNLDLRRALMACQAICQGPAEFNTVKEAVATNIAPQENISLEDFANELDIRSSGEVIAENTLLGIPHVAVPNELIDIRVVNDPELVPKTLPQELNIGHYLTEQVKTPTNLPTPRFNRNHLSEAMVRFAGSRARRQRAFDGMFVARKTRSQTPADDTSTEQPEVVDCVGIPDNLVLRWGNMRDWVVDILPYLTVWWRVNSSNCALPFHYRPFHNPCHDFYRFAAMAPVSLPPPITMPPVIPHYGSITDISSDPPIIISSDPPFQTRDDEATD